MANHPASNPPLAAPILVGHRGFPQHYPENSLAGFRAALEAGGDAVECDIQFSRDGEPLVIHDADLRRTAGRAGRIGDLSAAELKGVSVHEPKRFAVDAEPAPVPTLEELVALMGHYPQATVFVEIKEEAFADFSRRYCVDQVLSRIAPLGAQAVVISFDAEAVALAREAGAITGWVMRRYSVKTRLQATALAPDVLIIDYRKLPAEPAVLWPGNWRWFVYDVVDWPLAQKLCSRGVTYIETWDIGAMQAHKRQDVGLDDSE